MNSGLKCSSSASRVAVGEPAPRGGRTRSPPRRDVRGHDQHGVLEVDGAALAVGQAAVVEDLQERVEDVGVGLLDLVEQHDRVGAAADRLGQLAALVVADVAGRRADQARDGVPLHVLGHVDADHRVLGVEEELGERAGELGLADAGRAEEEERADRAVGVRQAGARAADRASRRPRPPRPGRSRARAGAPPCGRASATSPSSRRETGMPVQRATTSATSSASTSSLRKTVAAPASRPAAARPPSRSAELLLELGDLAVAQLGGALRGRRRARRARPRRGPPRGAS